MKPDWTVVTDDGVTLGVKTTEPVGAPVGEVLLLHAMMVDARSLDRPVGAGMATTLSRLGLRVHRADFRGRGMSPLARDWTYDDLVYRDVPALTAALPRPWVVGHSLGGHVTAATWGMGRCDIAGLVGIAANVWLKRFESSRRRQLAKSLGMAAMRVSLGAFGKVAARRIRMGPIDEAHGYGSDLRRYWVEDAWRDRSGVDWLEGLRTIDGPMLAVMSRGDRLLAHPVGARGFAEQVPGCEVWELDDGDFAMTPAPGHMGMGVSGRAAALWEGIGRWMIERS